MVVVTHNKDIVNSMRKRVVTMHEGSIISDEKENIMRPSTIWYTLKQGVKNIKRNWMFSWLPLSPWLPVFFCLESFSPLSIM